MFSIIAVKNGVRVGYVKSISYKNSTFKLTNDYKQARKFKSEDAVQGEIDKLTAMGYEQGYIFIY